MFYLRCEDDKLYKNYGLHRLHATLAEEMMAYRVQRDIAYRSAPHSWEYWNEELELFLPRIPAT